MPARPGAVRSVVRAGVVTLAVALVLAIAGPPVGTSASEGDTIGGVSVSGNEALASAVPEVDLPAGVVWTADGRVLWERNATAERAMASTTKIMTALVVLDSANLDDVVTVSQRAADVKEAGIDVVAGQKLTVRQLLEAMLVRSANDAAFALAEHTAGSVEAFVSRMNEKAAALGLTDTSFANPHGLDAQGHHTSARDLATLARLAMSDERFAEIVAMSAVAVVGGDVVKEYENSNRLLDTYEGATGVKTGWTDDAGYCVVASAERGAIGLLVVVLGAASEDDRFEQAEELLDWGFEHYAVTPLSSAEATVALVTVTDYIDRRVTAVVAEDVSAPVFDLAGALESTIDLVEEIDAPVERGDRLGTLTVTQGAEVLAQVPLVAAESVPEPTWSEAIGIWFERLWRRISGEAIMAPAVRFI